MRTASRLYQEAEVAASAPVISRPANVRRLSGGEAPNACGPCGATLAATNEEVGGRDLQAA